MEFVRQPPGQSAALPASRYARHRPETTLLYALVEQHYPEFVEALRAGHRPAILRQMGRLAGWGLGTRKLDSPKYVRCDKSVM